MELSVALMCEIFKYDPVAKKVREKIHENKLDPLMTYIIDAWYGRHSNQAVTIKDVTNTNRSYATADYFYGISGGYYVVGDDAAGIVVGTGSGTPSYSDYALGSKISHGSSSGQLYYYQCTVVTYGLTSPTKKRQLVWQRLFKNQSGANITVNETGVYYIGNYIQTFLFCREVISGGLSFLNGQYYLIQFIFEIGA
jgi:hypothetical protein